MWQTVLVLLILLGVSIYLVRYFVRAYRTEGSPCGGLHRLLFAELSRHF